MPRGGARPGSGRKRKSLTLHALQGTLRGDRHGAVGAAVLVLPAAVGAMDWRPAAGEVAELSPRARTWLEAVLRVYQLNVVEGQAVLEALRVLSRCEVLEAEPGMASAAALVRERKLFLSMWTSLRLER